MMVYLQMIEGGHNRQRFALLYDTYKGLMFRVARRLLHSDADAEDAVHEAFVALARNFSKINEIDCPQTRAYVVITVERKALDMLRSHSRHEAEELDEEVHGVEIARPTTTGWRTRWPPLRRSIGRCCSCGTTTAILPENWPLISRFPMRP